MKLNLAAFIDATRLHLSPAVAAAIPAAAAAMAGVSEPPETINDADAGELLLRAISGRIGGLQPIDLALVHLAIADEIIALDPADAAEHPMLGPWAPETLADALAAPVLAGTRATQAVLGAPRYGQLAFCEAENFLAGSLILHFGKLTAQVSYGPMNPDLPYVSSRIVKGDALFNLGQAGRRASAPVAPPKRSGGGSGGMEWPVVAETSGAVH